MNIGGGILVYDSELARQRDAVGQTIDTIEALRDSHAPATTMRGRFNDALDRLRVLHSDLCKLRPVSEFFPEDRRRDVTAYGFRSSEVSARGGVER